MQRSPGSPVELVGELSPDGVFCEYSHYSTFHDDGLYPVVDKKIIDELFEKYIARQRDEPGRAQLTEQGPPDYRCRPPSEDPDDRDSELMMESIRALVGDDTQFTYYDL